MTRRAAIAAGDEIAEADRLAGYPHPRESFVLFGQDAAQQAFLAAYASGRAHHAWLLTGPEGVGKAALAYRIARFVLTHPDPADPAVKAAASLHVPQQHPVARQVAALSHPDLFVLRRVWDARQKRLLSVLSVEEVRKALHFFAMTAAAGGWRVAIVDSADDMNASAANALLKTLEEPPPRSLLLLVSHAPGRLPATIRSRCRTLRIGPLQEGDLTAAIAAAAGREALSGLSGADRTALISLARGSVRRALFFLDGDGLALSREIDELLHAWPRLDQRRLYAFANRFARTGKERDTTVALSLLGDWIADRVERQAAGRGKAASLARLAEVWEKIAQLTAELEVFHYDRKLMILNALRLIEQAAD